jgi:hypothetical protein
MDQNGDFVIAWQSHNQDGSDWGIYAQKYNLLGVPVGLEFRVNTYTQDDQVTPSAAMDQNGDFVIVWASHNEDGSGWGIYGQRYSLLGVPQGGEFRVNTYTQGDQTNPSVTMNAVGGFDVTWSSNGQDGNGWGVYAAQFSSTGANLGSDFLVNTTTAGNQQYSSVDVSPSGRMVIAWSGNGVGDNGGVFLQEYDTLNSNEAVSDSYDPNGDDDGVPAATAAEVVGQLPGPAVAAAPVGLPGRPAAPQAGVGSAAGSYPFVNPLAEVPPQGAAVTLGVWQTAGPYAEVAQAVPVLLGSNGPLASRPAGFSDTPVGADSASGCDTPTEAASAGAEELDIDASQADPAAQLDVLDCCFLDPTWMGGGDSE